jgi:hypothetical protein
MAPSLRVDGHRFLTNQRLRGAHLPQGAPTSPALANLAAFRLDIRMAALAKRFGATMTRYADDIAFSGDREFDRSLHPHAGTSATGDGAGTAACADHRRDGCRPRGRGREPLRRSLGGAGSIAER